jgi:hypothetical protein
LDLYPVMGLLDHMVVLFLIFWWTSIMVIPIYIITNSFDVLLVIITWLNYLFPKREGNNFLVNLGLIILCFQYILYISPFFYFNFILIMLGFELNALLFLVWDLYHLSHVSSPMHLCDRIEHNLFNVDFSC